MGICYDVRKLTRQDVEKQVCKNLDKKSEPLSVFALATNLFHLLLVQLEALFFQ